MVAGDSAGRRAVALNARAMELEAEAQAARAESARYAIAEASERRMAHELARLAGVGYVLLPDRAWPGSKTAQVDMVVVGPGGVFIIDTKAWRAPRVEGGRIFRDQVDVTDELEGLFNLSQLVEEDLAEIGLAPGEVRPMIALAGRKLDRVEQVWGVSIVGERDVVHRVASWGERLTTAAVDAVLLRLVALFPPLNGALPPGAAPRQPLPAQTPRPVELPADSDPPLTDEEIDAAARAVMMSDPIEDWMVFLDPSQVKVVRRHFAGPSRVRGPAGTGKTVVALHRAAYLARTMPAKVLVTTFVGTLPKVQRSLLGRLDPSALDAVEFASVHGFVMALLKERGRPCNVDMKTVNAAFQAAWAAVAPDSPLKVKGLLQDYWKDEISKVMKGRAIVDFAQYADLARTGRRYALGIEQRKAVWELFLDYQQRLRDKGAMDFDDVIIAALDEVQSRPLTGRYSAVIVDEAQDLTCAMVRLLHALVGDEPDAFTLVGDGQQAVYPGGFTLAEAGVSVASRGVVLDTNYRNTKEILDVATPLVEGAGFDDIEVGQARGDVAREVPRHGDAPEVAAFVTPGECNAAVVAQVQRACELVGTGLGDVAVLCARRKTVEQVEAALGEAGVPTQNLEAYDGNPVDCVKVGTIKRAKGLEFKQVLLPHVSRELWSGAAPDEDAARERWDLDRRELFVGATRARDGLWVGLVG